MSRQIIVPIDRMGVENYQSDLVSTIKSINDSISSSFSVLRTSADTEFKTDLFPEGHLFSAGAFLIDEAAKDVLIEHGTRFQQVIQGDSDRPSEVFPVERRKIALYVGSGAADFCTGPLREVLDHFGFSYDQVDEQDIRNDALRSFSILIVPGGPDAGESYYAGLGTLGYEKLRRFALAEGSYFGICAGAYLALKSRTKKNRFWLDLADVTDEEDLDYWRTGTAFVRIRMDGSENPCFYGLTAGSRNTADMIYWEGPAMRVIGPNATSLARFDDFIAGGAPGEEPAWDLLDNRPARDCISEWYNVMSRQRFERHLKGTAAIVEATPGERRMLLYSPHAEFGNIGICERHKSTVFLLLANGIFYLSR